MSEQENKKETPKPTLEENPEGLPPIVVAQGAADLQFVLATFSQCVAHISEQGGDSRYKVQNAMIHARQALGVLVAYGMMEAETKLANGENLWLSPAVPPMGQQTIRNATLQAG